MSTKGLQAKSHPNQQLPVTPAIVKRKQVQQRNTFRSPTDSLVSPCSRVLRKAKFEASSSDQETNGKRPVPRCDGKENELS
ncbi:Hypothetical predicted protein [Pelobates cultripes]|uniref:Uncharacterized protein n=1 Tax=Pelobates cultripes TaxID=61616 RepID=A0AAD1RX38_PELCU|nr:Hypothetical predicted protein [Pelobates cultripes]CAH2277900.1 Hypothetical predicted protein [Pelobates cultripes]CAH2277901.1 Hypothetical predicted protein [Pelobates cultripes]